MTTPIDIRAAQLRRDGEDLEIPHVDVVRAVQFSVPLPFRQLSPNGNGSGSRRWSDSYVGAYRKTVKALALEAFGRKRWKPCRTRVSLLYGRKGMRNTGLYAPLDVGNAVSAWKAGFDGLTDAGVWPDDSWRWCVLGSVEVDPEAPAEVAVTLEALADLVRDR